MPDSYKELIKSNPDETEIRSFLVDGDQVSVTLRIPDTLRFGVLATGYIQTQYLPFHRSNRKRTQAFSRPSCPGFRYSQGLCLECF